MSGQPEHAAADGAAAQQNGSEGSAPPPRGRWRVLRRFLQVVAVLAVLVVAGLFGLLRWVESDSGRRVLIGAAAGQGVEVDFGRLEVRPVSGRLLLRDLRVAMPPEHSEVASDLLRIGEVEIVWSPAALFSKRLHLKTVRIDEVSAHSALDREGRSSFELLLPSIPPQDTPVPDRETPELSKTLSELSLPMGFRIDSLSVSNVRLQFSELREGGAKHLSFDGLDVQGRLRLDGSERQGELVVSSPQRAEGSSIVARTTEGDEVRLQEMDLAFAHRLVLDGGSIGLDSNARFLRQTFDAGLADEGRLLDLRAVVGLLHAQSTTRVEVERLDILDGAATATFALELPDGRFTPRVLHASGALNADPIVRLWPGVLGEIEAEDVSARVHFVPESDGETDFAGRLEVRGRAGRVAIRRGDDLASINAAKLRIDATFEEGRLGVNLEAPVEKITLQSGVSRIEARSAGVELELQEVDLVQDDLMASTGRGRARVFGVGLVVRSNAGDLDVLAPRLSMDAAFDGGSTIDAAVTLASGEVTTSLRGGERFVVEPFRLAARLPQMVMDGSRPAELIVEGEVPRIRAMLPEGTRATVEGLRIEGKGTLSGDDRIAARLAVPIRVVHFSAPGEISLRMDGPFLGFGLRELELNPAEPLRASGGMSIDLRTGGVSVSTPQLSALLGSSGLSLTGHYHGAARSSLSGSLPFGGLAVALGAESSAEIIEPGELRVELKDLAVDWEHLWRSRGRVEVVGSASPFAFQLSSSFANGEANGSMRGDVLSFSMLDVLVGKQRLKDVGVDASRISAQIEGNGRWSGIDGADPRFEHHASASLSGFELHGPGERIILPRVGIRLDHEGDQQRHRASIAGTFADPIINELEVDGAISGSVTADVDLPRRVAQLVYRAGGPEGPDVKGEGEVTISSAGVLNHASRIAVSRLGVLASAIPMALRESHPVRMDALSLEIGASGELSGVFTPDLKLAHDFPASTHARERLEATVRGLVYAPGGMSLEVPEVKAGIEVESRAGSMSAALEIEAPRVEFDDTRHRFSILGTKQLLRVGMEGDLPEGRITVDVDGSVSRVEQQVFPAYPMEDLLVRGRLVIDRLQSAEIESLVFANEKGGTRLELSKTLNRSRKLGSEAAAPETRPGGKSLSLKGEFSQDLSRIDRQNSAFTGRGRITAPFQLESGDGALFRVEAAARLDDVHLALPEAGLVVESARGTVVVEEAFEWSPTSGVKLVPYTERNVFARVRFQDVQPFLSGDSHLRVDRVRWGDVEFGPVDGSMRVDRNVFAIHKLKVEKDGGLVSGQLLVDYLPGSERISFRGNVTGLRPGGAGEPLDANAAIVITPSKLEVDGRMQIVRISRKHMLAMLDLVDPYREDPGLNSLRRTLKFGYPRRVRINLSQGLMSMGVDLGGLAGLVNLDEIRGLSVGPFMSRHVAPLLPSR